ncbi:hypothetical protein HK099_005150 [Clydaea vesicula]|uniref:Delta-aminolevulinic acid dehydratase n=1 Tax=Clydaea vesicula TaxID=447962 RepID=A0AAD5Y3C2_9FUNG|nr:hypothetical protein HK099_005150 [Clydaea vesicula]KAJ3395344.1 hypothetical protein HDU92_006000 [Lobulomyces angularis]
MKTNSIPTTSYLHSSFGHPVLRSWSELNTNLTKESLIYPLFITDDANAVEEIKSLPDVYRYGVNKLEEVLTPLVRKGLKSVILFGVPKTAKKDNFGTSATSEANPVLPAIRLLRKKFSELLICCDVCLCAYTDHGHCGILKDGELENIASIQRLAEVAGTYALAGAHVVAPSDMMDGRILAIKNELIRIGKGSKTALMSYSAKFASSFYGPFRDAAESGVKGGGDRKCYQLPVGSRGLARRALQRDMAEGADMVMVKPGGPYLDIIRDGKVTGKLTRELCTNYPVAVYQVSGEYAMLWHGAKNGVFDLKVGVLESLTSFYRAGANVIITYYTPKILEWIDERNYPSKL